MFATILCATDGSEHADRALRFATDLARENHSQLHIVHVVERFTAGRLAGQNVFPDESAISDSIKAQTVEILGQTGLGASLHVAKATTSHVAERIAEIANNLDADLIVIGTHGRTQLGGLVLGSVTQRLLHTTSRPVLALPPTRDSAEGLAPVERLRSTVA